MKRLTTDKPMNNLEALLNYAHGKDGRACLSYADGEYDVDLCEYVASLCRKKGCDMTADSVMESGCMECDCEMAVLYVAATQAAELRAKLKAYEDAEEQGRLVELPPCKSGDNVWIIYEDKIHKLRVQGMSLTITNKVLLHFGGYPITCIYALELGKKFFLTREEAEAALDAEKEQTLPALDAGRNAPMTSIPQEVADV